MNAFSPPADYAKFDRVVTVEMFEHMRNWEVLLDRVSTWLKPDGLMFMHVFAHKTMPYPFDDNGESDWMSRFFFSGGMMPSHDQISRLQCKLVEQERWAVSGNHYARTCEDWLQNFYNHRTEILQLFSQCYGVGNEECWYQRWKLFFLACAELFAFNEGNEWIVSHHLLRQRANVGAGAAIGEKDGP